MILSLYFLVFIGCLLIIIKSGTLLVKSLVDISRFLGFSEYIVAFILMAFATSIPELFIGITSALKAVPSISFGNILGANVLNLTLALGLVIIVAGEINIKDQIVKRDAWFIFFLSLTPVILVLDGVLSRTDGLILILLFAWYIKHLTAQRNQFSEKMNLMSYNWSSAKKIIKSFIFFILGLVLLLIAAWGVVWSSSLIATQIGFSLTLIGLILVSFGTTMPELSFGIRSALLQHKEMAVGNFIGSIIFNSLVILGLVALIHPFSVDLQIAIIGILFLSLLLIILNVFIATKDKLSYREGVVLLLLYLLFLIAILIIG